MNRILLYLLFTFSCVFSQQDIVYSQYMYGLSFINPANVAQTEKINATIFARKQSIGDGNSPFSQSFAIQTPFSFQKMGIGVLVTNETFFYRTKACLYTCVCL